MVKDAQVVRNIYHQLVTTAMSNHLCHLWIRIITKTRKKGRTKNESVLNISVNSDGKTQTCRTVKQKCLTIITTI